MKISLSLSVFCLVTLGSVAKAHEYALQFTPNPGARGLIVAGYDYEGADIVGNCSYYTVHSGSGRGGGYHTVTTHYNQTCKWNLFGNLVSVTPGAPPIPAPLYKNGTETVYDINGKGEYTGADSRLPQGGFVNTPGSNYHWLTSNAYKIIQQTPYSFTATLQSDGDLPLAISTVEVGTLRGIATVKAGTCIGHIAVGKTCSVTVSYDPTQIVSDGGTYAYDTLTLTIISNSGLTYDFVQGYTIVLKPNTDGGTGN